MQNKPKQVDYDLAQSLADALEGCADALCGTEEWQHGMERQSEAENKARAALKKYRGE